MARLLLYATPLTLLLFFLTPDFKGPLWELPSDAYEAQTGLSNEMSPGRISSLMDSNDVVFRVKFQRMPQDKASFIASLYWRGPVFGFFDGQTWQPLNQTLRSPTLQSASLPAPVPDEGAFLKTAAPADRHNHSERDNQYHITLEPHYNNWLFTLNTPVEVQEGFYLTSDDELLSRYAVTQPLQYTLKLNSTYAGHSPPPDSRYLRMPGFYGRKTKALVQQLQEQLDPELPYDTQIVTKVLDYFREQPFFYSKKPPLTNYDPVDEFIFKTKTGFCEHYASAFTFMMRAAGIPARVATGYLGGEYNAVGDYIIVRQSNAHAWTEVWLHGKGWVRVDPTAVLPPYRVDTGNDNPYVLAGLVNWDNAAFSHISDWLDNLSFHWYGLLANVFQARSQHWVSWIFYSKHYVLVVLLLLLSTSLVWRYLQREAAFADPVLRVYDNFCRKLNRRGYVRSPYESAGGFAERVCADKPDLAHSVRTITGLYHQLRYGKTPSQTAYKQLCREVTRFRP